MLEFQARDRSIEQGTNQKGIGHPTVQEEHEIRNNSECAGVDGLLVSKRSRWCHTIDTRIFAVVDVGNGLKVELHRNEHGHDRKRGRDV